MFISVTLLSRTDRDNVRIDVQLHQPVISLLEMMQVQK